MSNAFNHPDRHEQQLPPSPICLVGRFDRDQHLYRVTELLMAENLSCILVKPGEDLSRVNERTIALFIIDSDSFPNISDKDLNQIKLQAPIVAITDRNDPHALQELQLNWGAHTVISTTAINTNLSHTIAQIRGQTERARSFPSQDHFTENLPDQIQNVLYIEPAVESRSLLKVYASTFGFICNAVPDFDKAAATLDISNYTAQSHLPDVIVCAWSPRSSASIDFASFIRFHPDQNIRSIPIIITTQIPQETIPQIVAELKQRRIPLVHVTDAAQFTHPDIRIDIDSLLRQPSQS